MTTHVRTPAVTVTGQTKVLRAHTAFGLDLAVSEASYTIASVDYAADAPALFSAVTIQIGAHGTWDGYVTEVDTTYYPGELTVQCRGPLIKAQLTTMQDYASTTSVTGQGGKLMVPNDLSGVGDGTIIANILGTLGITSSVSPGIQGTNRFLGTIALTPFIWAEGESALSFMQRLDEACAWQPGGVGNWLQYRTYDDVGGVVSRAPIDPVPTGSPSLTFTEGVDIWRGTSGHDILTKKNKVTVTGFDTGGGSGAVNYTLLGSAGVLPTDTALQVSNPMIECQTETDPVARGGGFYNGLSCEALVNALIYAWNRKQEKITFTTPEDVDVSVGDTIAIATPSTLPERLGIVGDCWVQRVERDIADDGTFSLNLTVLKGAA